MLSASVLSSAQANADADQAHNLIKEMGVWVAPFVMAPINTRNVHRTNALLGHKYGAGLVYEEMMVTGPGEKGDFIENADKGFYAV